MGGGWNGVDTTVRLDSKTIGLGTEVNFEDDLEFDSSTVSPEVTVSWRAGRRHLLTFFWSDIDRDRTVQVTGEIRLGGLEIPFDATVRSAFDVQTLSAGYHYYPLLGDRLAFGIGGGVRWLDVLASVAIEGEIRGISGATVEEADGTGPFPFLGIEVRYGLSSKWRLVSSLSAFELEVGDVDGSQALLGVEVEHLVARHFSWGFKGNVSVIDLRTEDDEFETEADLDVNRLGVFIKARW